MQINAYRYDLPLSFYATALVFNFFRLAYYFFLLVY